MITNCVDVAHFIGPGFTRGVGVVMLQPPRARSPVASSGRWCRHVRAGCTVETAGDALAALAVDGLGLLRVT